jgi:hypothetical protein
MFRTDGGGSDAIIFTTGENGNGDQAFTKIRNIYPHVEFPRNILKKLWT